MDNPAASAQESRSRPPPATPALLLCAECAEPRDLWWTASHQRDGPHGRSLGADELERQRKQRETVLVDAVEVLQIRHGDHAVLAEGARIVEHARGAGLVVAVIEVIADDRHTLVDAPHGRTDGEVRGLLH